MTEATAALMGDNGGTASGAATTADTKGVWSAEFDEDTNAYVQNKGWQSPVDLLSSYRNLEKFVGGSKSVVNSPVRMPTRRHGTHCSRNSVAPSRRMAMT